MIPHEGSETSGLREIAHSWLSNEDSKGFEDRLNRLHWLSERTPDGDYWTFPGGFVAKSLFEEMRYSFVYAQFLATIFTGLAYIERTLAASLFGAGRDDLERGTLSKLLEEACKNRLISESELEELTNIRQLRNAYAHYRRPGHTQGVEYRANREDQAFYEIIEQDAITVVGVALRLVDKRLF